MSSTFVMVAPNGARRGKVDHKALPVTIPEIVASASACHMAGANALHLHVRDSDGQHSLDAGLYKEALAELEKHVPSLMIQITTESAGRFSVREQLVCLQKVRPAWASISVREIARDPDIAPRVYALCAEQGIKVQHILYDTEDIQQLISWQRKEVIHLEQQSVLFVLGRYSEGQKSSPNDLWPFRHALSNVRDWMVCAFGPNEHECLLRAAEEGGNVRVGFENSLISANGVPHADNASSVGMLIQSLRGSMS